MLYKCQKCGTICGPLDEIPDAIVIEHCDVFGNISYLTVGAKGGVQLTSGNGIPLALSNIFHHRAMEASLRLRSAGTVNDALAICHECTDSGTSFCLPNWLKG